MNFFQRLKAERERLGYNQTEFAALAGASKHSQINWEQGVASPNSQALEAWSKHGVDVLYLVIGQRSLPIPEVDLLPQDERILLDNYRNSPPEGRAALKATSAALAAAGTAQRMKAEPMPERRKRA